MLETFYVFQEQETTLKATLALLESRVPGDKGAQGISWEVATWIGRPGLSLLGSKMGLVYEQIVRPAMAYQGKAGAIHVPGMCHSFPWDNKRKKNLEDGG